MIRLLLFSAVFTLSTIIWAQPSFVEVSKEAGIDHLFEVDMATFGGGAAVIDIDNDGWEDLYIAGGEAFDALYRNNGDGTFSNIISAAGFERTQEMYTQGATAADVNRDGFKDLLVTTMNYVNDLQNQAPNLLYINNGDGTFRDATKEFGLEDHRIFSTGATFGDINADGLPDLYVSNYFYIAEEATHISVLNESIITGEFIPAADYLFINSGGNTFIDVSELYGMDHTGYGFQGVFSDFDNDGDLDLHIANDFGYRRTPNVFLRNEYPQKQFADKSVQLAMNYGLNAMGIARGDINDDGWMDFYVTNISTSLLAENGKNGRRFEDVTLFKGVAISSIHDSIYNGVPVSWGANFFDYDHDMDEDLFVANGALNPTFRLNPNFFFECNSDGNFAEKAEDVGLYDVRIGRGSVVFDYDNDGDMDLFVVNQKPRDNVVLDDMPPAQPLLYRNDAGNGNWLKIKLKGVNADPDGIGSRIDVFVGNRQIIREIDGGSSHLSQNSTIAHVGLGQYDQVDRIEVKWIGGKTQVLTNVAANQMLTIEEEAGRKTFEALRFEVIPEAFEDEMTIFYELEGNENVLESIDVLDINGRKVHSFTSFPSHTATGLVQWKVPAGLAQGMYLVRMNTKLGVITEKAIKL